MKINLSVPKVCVITLNYNQKDYTKDCINSLLKSTYLNFEVLLVDNGSSQENFTKLENELPNDNRLIISRLEENIGYVGGINHGLLKASEKDFEYFLIMNNDTLIDENAIKELIITAEKHNGNAIVSGKVYNYDEKDTLQYIGNVYSDRKGILDYKSPIKNRREKDVGQFDTEMEMAMTDDIMWVIPRKIFKDIGYYSDYFYLYGEQTDYAIKAQKKGYRLIYSPKAKIWHKGGITTTNGNKKSARIIYWTTFATLKIAKLHFTKNESKKFFRQWLLRMTIKRILYFFKRKENFTILKAHTLAIIHFCFWSKIKYTDNGYNPF
ncbi:glycosyltransferase family 2 protein [Polaribacter gangjinensis]|uniref:Glycosyltransferase 2-like domain-containing protein n=1 Tax=Polaribacter gangjinensis TaxID=574710 RepID=A0A2S7W8Q8_9FLAO|nr:glycosyltransferase family 2 protein [Polaribacter gangjinensis]PQJ73796.1 hypothetical protein BTO13_00220 [Polaribacter gangjinensis]